MGALDLDDIFDKSVDVLDDEYIKQYIIQRFSINVRRIQPSEIHIENKRVTIQGTLGCTDLKTLNMVLPNGYKWFKVSNLYIPRWFTSLQGCPTYVSIFSCSYNQNITNLLGSPIYVEKVYMDCCKNLVDLTGISRYCDFVSVTGCENLTSIEGIREDFNGTLCCGLSGLSEEYINKELSKKRFILKK